MEIFLNGFDWAELFKATMVLFAVIDIFGELSARHDDARCAGLDEALRYAWLVKDAAVNLTIFGYILRVNKFTKRLVFWPLMLFAVKEGRVVPIVRQGLRTVLGVVELAVGTVHAEPLLVEEALFLATRA